MPSELSIMLDREVAGMVAGQAIYRWEWPRECCVCDRLSYWYLADSGRHVCSPGCVVQATAKMPDEMKAIPNLQNLEPVEF